MRKFGRGVGLDTSHIAHKRSRNGSRSKKRNQREREIDYTVQVCKQSATEEKKKLISLEMESMLTFYINNFPSAMDSSLAS